MFPSTGFLVPTIVPVCVEPQLYVYNPSSKISQQVKIFILNKKKPYMPCLVTIENRIYREELEESLGMNFFSPFQSEREYKVYKSCKFSQIICSTVH